MTRLHEGPPAWLLWQIDADAGVAVSDRGLAVRIAPFHGVTGVAWDEPGEHSTIPPRAVGGGNIDCRELVWCGLADSRQAARACVAPVMEAQPAGVRTLSRRSRAAPRRSRHRTRLRR